MRHFYPWPTRQALRGLCALAVAACADPPATEVETGDFATTQDSARSSEPIPLTLLTVSAVCPDGAAGQQVEITSRTAATSDGVPVLDIWDTGTGTGYNEEHLGIVTATGKGGAWEDQAWPLNVVANFPAAIGETVFSCPTQWEHLDTALTLAIRVYDLDGNVADCAAFGHRAADVATGLPDFPDASPVSNVTEFATCVVFSAS